MIVVVAVCAVVPLLLLFVMAMCVSAKQGDLSMRMFSPPREDDATRRAEAMQRHPSAASRRLREQRVIDDYEREFGGVR